MTAKKRFFHKWQPEEIEIIDRWGGEKPIDDIVKMIQSLDKRKGWPARTKSAVESKTLRLGYSLMPIVDNFRVHEIANLLGVSPQAVSGWIYRYGLPCKKRADRRQMVSRKDFQEWAYKNERFLSGRDRDGLFMLTENADFADRVSKQKSLHRPNVVLKRLDTGEVFKSSRMAEKATRIADSTLREFAAREKEFVLRGIRWRVL